MTENRLDPEVRARLAVDRLRAREVRRGAATAVACGVCGAACIAAASDRLGEGGTVGAAVGALVLLVLAWGIWPVAWCPRERDHRELEAMWGQARPDATEGVAWDRFAAWARSVDDAVVLLSLRRAGTTDPRLSPYSLQEVERIGAGEPERAAESMERLRADAAKREAGARQAHERSVARREQETHDAALREIDEAAAAEIRVREAAIRQEVEAAEAAERRAQADAVARALRQP